MLCKWPFWLDHLANIFQKYLHIHCDNRLCRSAYSHPPLSCSQTSFFADSSPQRSLFNKKIPPQGQDFFCWPFWLDYLANIFQKYLHIHCDNRLCRPAYSHPPLSSSQTSFSRRFEPSAFAVQQKKSRHKGRISFVGRIDWIETNTIESLSCCFFSPFSSQNSLKCYTLS